MATAAVTSTSRSAARGAVEAARGALLAVHAAAGLVAGTREGKRLLFAAEGLCRAAVAVLSQAAEASSGEAKGTATARRRKRGKGKTGKEASGKQREEGGEPAAGSAPSAQQAATEQPLAIAVPEAHQLQPDPDAYMESSELGALAFGGGGAADGRGAACDRVPVGAQGQASGRKKKKKLELLEQGQKKKASSAASPASVERPWQVVGHGESPAVQALMAAVLREVGEESSQRCGRPRYRR